MPTPISATIGKSQPTSGTKLATMMPPAASASPASSTGPAPTRSTAKPDSELRDAARRVVDADQRAENGIARAELGAQQREERRQRELEEMRHQMREADDADHGGIAAERLGAGEIQGGVVRENLNYT